MIELDPNFAQGYTATGLGLMYAGRSAEALEPIAKAMRLDPHHAPIVLHFLAQAEFQPGRIRDRCPAARAPYRPHSRHGLQPHAPGVLLQAGITIAHEETYGPRDSDMTPQLTNIRTTPGVQAVVNPGFGQGPAIVTRNYRQLGITLPLYQSHGVASKQFIELAGPAAEGVRLPAAALLVANKLPDSDPQKPIVVNYTRTYEQKSGQAVSTFGGHAYDGLMIFTQAMTRAGSADKAKVRDEIEKTKGYVGTGGIVNMTNLPHLAASAHVAQAV